MQEQYAIVIVECEKKIGHFISRESGKYAQ